MHSFTRKPASARQVRTGGTSASRPALSGGNARSIQLLNLQQTVGNRAVMRMVQAMRVETGSGPEAASCSPGQVLQSASAPQQPLLQKTPDGPGTAEATQAGTSGASFAPYTGGTGAGTSGATPLKSFSGAEADARLRELLQLMGCTPGMTHHYMRVLTEDAFDCIINLQGIEQSTVYKVFTEIIANGLYGPEMEAAIANGLLPPGPKTHVERKALQVRWFVLRGDYPSAFYHINGMAMIDIVDMLRIIPASEAGLLRQHLDQDGTGFDVPRMRSALDTVLTHQAPADLSHLPADQQAILRGFTSLRDWCKDEGSGGLRRAKRTGVAPGTAPTHIRETGKKPKPGEMPLVIPDIGFDKSQLSDGEWTWVELIARHRERLPEIIGAANAKNDFDGSGYSYRGKTKAIPTALQSSGTTPADNDKVEKLKALRLVAWKEITGEGQASSLLTGKGQGITLGYGYGGRGLLPELMKTIFAKHPDVRDALLDAGIAYTDTWLVVNTEIGAVETGNDALALLRYDTQLQNALVSVMESDAIGTSGRTGAQEFVDAQYEVFANRNSVPAIAAEHGWSDEYVAFAAHATWYGRSSWPDFIKLDGNLKAAVQWYARKWSRKAADGADLVTGEAAVAFQNFGKTSVGHAVIDQFLSPQQPGLPTGGAGHIYFEVRFGNTVKGYRDMAP